MKEQTVLITGAGDGLGFYTAGILLKRGANLIAVVRDRRAFEKKVSDGWSFSTERLNILECDLSRLEEVRKLLSEIDFSKIDVCIQSAGLSRFGTFESLSEEEISSIVNVNLTAPILVSSHFVRNAHAGSMLVNVTSITSYLPLPRNALYSAVKQALSTLTLATSREMRRNERNRQVRVLEFCPGSLATSFHKKASGASNVPSKIAMRPDICGELLVRAIDRSTSGSIFPDLIAKIVHLATWNIGRLITRLAF